MHVFFFNFLFIQHKTYLKRFLALKKKTPVLIFKRNEMFILYNLVFFCNYVALLVWSLRFTKRNSEPRNESTK